MGLLGGLLWLGHIEEAVAVLVAFMGYLRPGDLRSLASVACAARPGGRGLAPLGSGAGRARARAPRQDWRVRRERDPGLAGLR
eukprot:8646508-Pyramimonas_sp.AAC.1